MSSFITLKLKLADEIRRLPLSKEDASSFANFEKFVRSVFVQRLPNDEQFAIKYTDEEQDEITVSSDPELEECLRSVQNGMLTLRIFRQNSNTTRPNCPFSKMGAEAKGEFPPCGRRRGFMFHMLNQILNNNSNTGESNFENENLRGCPRMQRPCFGRERPQGPHHGFGRFATQQNSNNTNNGESKFKHWGIICDGCGYKNIEGKRYCCLDCQASVPGGVDFCEKCYQSEEAMKKIHPTSHTLLEIIDNNHDYAIPRGACGRRGFFGRGNWCRKNNTNPCAAPAPSRPEKPAAPSQKAEEPELLEDPFAQLISLVSPQWEEQKPEQKKPEEKKPEGKKPEEKKPEEKKPEEQKPSLFVEKAPEMPQPAVQKPLTEFERKLQTLTEMGFEKADCISALVKTRGNTVEAIKILLE